jgi:hypothetical protein
VPRSALEAIAERVMAIGIPAREFA